MPSNREDGMPGECRLPAVATQLQRRREGLQLTKAAVLLDASRTVLSLVDHEVNRTRQAAGLGRQRPRVVVPPRLPDAFAVEAASALRSAVAAADVDLVWMEAPVTTGQFAGDLCCLRLTPAACITVIR
jgi:hypothetical protein